MSWFVVPRRDRFTAQAERAFVSLLGRGFVVADRSSYRLGETLTLAKGSRGVNVDADYDCNVVRVDLRPQPWAGYGAPHLDLEEVARALAPELLDGHRALPRLVREADRAPHLEFWAGVLEVVAGAWLDGDDDWWERTAPLVADLAERRLRASSAADDALRLRRAPKDDLDGLAGWAAENLGLDD